MFQSYFQSVHVERKKVSAKKKSDGKILKKKEKKTKTNGIMQTGSVFVWK